jgi:homogentisate phytyltransferase/homogentisate geranylgeranyltransferase
VRTLGVRLGPSFVFNLCLALLTVAYGTAGFASVANAVSATSRVVGGIHAVVIVVLLAGSRHVDVSSSDSLYDYYITFIWKAFYLEYFLLPFVCFA